MSSLIKSSMSLFLMQGVNYIIPLITLPYLTRVLGIYEYGALSTALGIIAYATLFIDFGFNLSATKSIASGKGDFILVNNVFWVTLFSKLALFFMVLLLFLPLIFSVDKYIVIQITILCLIPQLLGSVLFPMWLFLGVERVYIVSFISVLSKVLVVPFLFLFVSSPSDMNLAAFILGFPLFLSGVVSFLFVRRCGVHFTLPEINLIIIINALKKSMPIFLGSVAISIYTACTPIILSLVGNYNEVGIYTAADKLRFAVLGVFLVFGQAIYPRVNYLISKDKYQYYKVIRALISGQLVLGTLGGWMFFLFMPELSSSFLGVSDKSLLLIIKVMSPMIFFIPFSVIFSNFILLPMGNSKMFAFIPVLTATLHIPYAIFLSMNYGALGSAVSILITEFISFSALFVFCYKKGYFKSIFSLRSEC
ncbi:MAG: oligosaccharide flippase family protein [Plesiomonas sp.]